MAEKFLSIPRWLIALGQKQITFRVNGPPTVDPKFPKPNETENGLPRKYKPMFDDPIAIDEKGWKAHADSHYLPVPKSFK